jgi:hypothetical protein
MADKKKTGGHSRDDIPHPEAGTGAESTPLATESTSISETGPLGETEVAGSASSPESPLSESHSPDVPATETPAETATEPHPPYEGLPETEERLDAQAETAAMSEHAPEPHPEPHPAPQPEPSPHPAAVHAEEAHEEHHEEERGSSFASKLLLALVLLIAGAALGIWGAPKLAPMLPSGMAPVAEWLTPGQSGTEARFAELQTGVQSDLDALRAEIAAASSTSDVEDRIAAAVAEVESRTAAEITALRDQIAATDGAEARDRLGSLESSLDGITAELTDLKAQIASGAVGDGEAAEAAVAQIDVYRSELAGLRAEFADVNTRVAALSARIDEVAASAERRVAEAQSQVEEVQETSAQALSAVEIEADINLIRSALASGQPYAEATDRLAGQAGITLPDGLTAAAASGVATTAQLRNSFSDAAHEAIRASIVASAGEGVLARSRAFLEAQVASRSLTPQPGLTPDAVLSRMEDALRRDDLATAIAEAGDLPSEAAGAMSGWLEAARARAAALDGFATLTAETSATN